MERSINALSLRKRVIQENLLILAKA